ncbi:MAG: hypothetical protein ACXWZX_19100 [Mycobacterium sp.]
MTNTIPNLPIPAGATADDWPSITAEGVLVRSLTWSEHDTPKVGVSVCGEQFADDGRYTRDITLFVEGVSLTADEAERSPAS